MADQRSKEDGEGIELAPSSSGLCSHIPTDKETDHRHPSADTLNQLHVDDRPDYSRPEHVTQLQRHGLMLHVGQRPSAQSSRTDTRSHASELSAVKRSESDPARKHVQATQNIRYKIAICILVLFLIAAIISLAIGWIKYAEMKDENAKLRTGVGFSNVTATSTGLFYESTPVYDPPAPSDIPLVAGFCPPPQEGRQSPLIKTGSGNDFFECYNGTYFAHGNLAAYKAYTSKDCADACSVYNEINNGTICIAFTMTPDLAKVYDDNHQSTCWLKGNGTTGEGPSDLAISARLCKGKNCGETY